MSDQHKWQKRFIELARHIATWSKDPSTQTGCVIVDHRRSIVSTGYNGFPRGVDDAAARLADRPTKYAYTVHCEANAILDAAARGIPLAGCSIYINGAPCVECMKSIIQAGITSVAWPKNNPFESDPTTNARWAESLQMAEVMAREAGVRVLRIEP